MFETLGPVSWRAGGNVPVSCFVKVGSADHTVVVAGANDMPVGISIQGSNDPPGVSGSGGYAAVSGQNCMVYGAGSVCWLLIGSGGVARGGFLKSDASGNGVAIATTGATAQMIGAMALESASAGELCRVVVTTQHKVYPALS